MHILEKQYFLTLQARGATLAFVENSIGAEFSGAIAAFNNKSIRDLFVHNAACYLSWIDHFAFRQPKPNFKEGDFNTMTSIRQLYQLVDERTNAFMQRFGNNLDERISGDPVAWGAGSATALELFTHVMTHEFHHKGQILLMCRHLGHTPPDTDVSIAFSEI
jgi:uncharacterized damage-inducible protein DinB